MKRLALMTLAALLTMSFSLMAQQNTGKQGQRTEMRWTAKERSEKMAKQLNLSDEQKAKVEALFEKQDAKRKEMMAKQMEKRDEMTQDREARRKEMMEMRNQAVAENDAELETIIGKEKMDEWKKVRDEQQKTMRGDAKRPGRRNMQAPQTK
ncbi:MAG: Spy/CpxP family protein refolding chaperone [Proteiniphilum sp.]